jgi:hypothetical protein
MMEVFHFSNRRRGRLTRRISPGINLERESSTPFRDKSVSGHSNERSRDPRTNVARHFVKMTEAHDRIRSEILGASQRKSKGHSGANSTRAARVR